MTTEIEALQLSLFEHRFGALTREMGEMLRRMALSTNVKERLDFSCTLLDAEGRLVVNAPHMPVHLGAMGLCVRSVARVLPLTEGDVAITNHPGHGGSHLPDVTLITPVVWEGELIGYVANRAHHAEIGGIRPGSVPPDARNLEEEGVVIAPRYLMRGGEERWDELRDLLTSARYPTRSVEENLADIGAQLASNVRGQTKLLELAREHGPEQVTGFMTALRSMAADRMRSCLTGLGDRTVRARELLDDGSPLAVEIAVRDGTARIDFEGSAEVHPGNLNATPAIVAGATLYVLRLLVDQPLPLNEGLFEPVEMVIPRGILDPEFPDDPALAPAVVGGNVETSQRLVDTLLRAFGLAACSQGTMNNLIFGDASFGYYETICGGAGATASRDGADAVHTHMTNTRITDPEILEARYPVRLRRFEIRRGSGGSGVHRGGDGVVRELEFLAPVELSLLSQHRREAPYGMEGGQPGAVGRQWLLRRDGECQELAGITGIRLESGDRLVIETPGGGGWGDRTLADE